MLFHYTIRFLCENDDIFINERDEHGIVTERGLIAANNYGDAAQRIAEYVGEENVVDLSIYECENPLCYDDLKDFLAQ